MSNFSYTEMTSDMIEALNYLRALYVNNKYNTNKFLIYIARLRLPQEFIDDKKTYISIVNDDNVSIRKIDPWQLLSIYNHIIQMLHLQKDTIIGELLVDKSLTNKTLCWIDTLTKLINAPNRIQATLSLEKPSLKPAQPSCICRLVYMGGRELARVFLRDKVGKVRTLPTRIPLGKLLSTYFAIIMYLQIDKRNKYVLSTGAGEWARGSSEVKNYIQGLDVPPRLFPRQHFIRTLFLNKFLIQRQYSEHALKLAGILSRNEGDTIEKYYASWASMYHEMSSKRKIYICRPDFSVTRHLEFVNEVWDSIHKQYTPPPQQKSNERPDQRIDDMWLKDRVANLITKRSLGTARAKVIKLTPSPQALTGSYYLGVDASKRGMALTVYDKMNDRYYFHFWHDHEMDETDKVGVVRTEYIFHHTKPNSSTKVVLASFEGVLDEYIKQAPLAQSIFCIVEKGITPMKNKFDGRQTRFTEQVILLLKSKLLHVKEIAPFTIKRNFLRDLSATDKTKIRTNFRTYQWETIDDIILEEYDDENEENEENGENEENEPVDEDDNESSEPDVRSEDSRNSESDDNADDADDADDDFDDDDDDDVDVDDFSTAKKNRSRRKKQSYIKSKFETYIQFKRIFCHDNLLAKTKFHTLLDNFRNKLHPLGDIADSFAACTIGMNLEKWGPTRFVSRISPGEYAIDEKTGIIELLSSVKIPIGSVIRVDTIETGVTYSGDASYDTHNPSMMFYFVKRFDEVNLLFLQRKEYEQNEYSRATKGPIRPTEERHLSGEIRGKSTIIQTYLWNTIEYNEYPSTGTVIRGHDNGDDTHEIGKNFCFIWRNFDSEEVNIVRRTREYEQYRARNDRLDGKLGRPVQQAAS